MMKCDKEKIKDDKENEKKRIKRMRMKGSQGEERESSRVRIWGFTKTDKGGWERQEQVGVAEEFVEEADVVVSEYHRGNKKKIIRNLL